MRDCTVSSFIQVTAVRDNVSAICVPGDPHSSVFGRHWLWAFWKAALKFCK
jgi:hypothetical protein